MRKRGGQCLRCVLEHGRAVPDRDPPRLEACERGADAKESGQGMDAEAVALAGEEEAGRAERLGTDEEPAVCDPEGRFVPAAADDHPALLDAVDPDTAPPERPRQQPADAKARGDCLCIALMAIEKRRNAEHRATRSQRLVEPGRVDRIHHERAFREHDCRRRPLDRLSRIGDPRERPGIVELDRAQNARLTRPIR